MKSRIQNDGQQKILETVPEKTRIESLCSSKYASQFIYLQRVIYYKKAMSDKINPYHQHLHFRGCFRLQTALKLCLVNMCYLKSKFNTTIG